MNIEPAFAKAMAGRASNQPSLKLWRAGFSTSNQPSLKLWRAGRRTSRPTIRIFAQIREISGFKIGPKLGQLQTLGTYNFKLLSNPVLGPGALPEPCLE